MGVAVACVGNRFSASKSTVPMSQMGRSLLVGHPRRAAGMLRIAVAPPRTTRHPARSPASGTHVGQQRPVATGRFAEHPGPST